MKKKFLVVFVFLLCFLLWGCEDKESGNNQIKELENKIEKLEIEKQNLIEKTGVSNFDKEKNEVRDEQCFLNASVEKGKCICNIGYALSLDKSYCLKVPQNAHAIDSNTDVWLCNEGYYESGYICLKKKLQMEDAPVIEPDSLTISTLEAISPTINSPMISINLVKCDTDEERTRLYVNTTENTKFVKCTFDILFSNPKEVFSVDLENTVLVYRFFASQKDTSVRPERFQKINSQTVVAGSNGYVEQVDVWFDLHSKVDLKAFFFRVERDEVFIEDISLIPIRSKLSFTNYVPKESPKMH
jgi:hypothetical protein